MPAPGKKKTCTREKAWALYRKTPAEVRSINALHASLKAQGYAIARNTLTKWADEGRWDEKLATGDKLAAQDPDVLEARAAANDVIERSESGTLLTSNIDDLLGVCAAMAVGIAKTVQAKLPDIAEFDVADMRTMVGATVDVAKAINEIQANRPTTESAQAPTPVPAGGMTIQERLAAMLAARSAPAATGE